MSVPSQKTGEPRAAGLYTIITIKLGKAVLLLLLALGIFSLAGNDLGIVLERFLRFVRVDPEREFFVELGQRLESITPTALHRLASGTLLYAILLFVESFGLMCRSVWAVWMAIGETGFFIPLEISHLVRKFSWTVTIILVVNVVIVVYLVRNRHRLFHRHL